MEDDPVLVQEETGARDNTTGANDMNNNDIPITLGEVEGDDEIEEDDTLDSGERVERNNEVEQGIFESLEENDRMLEEELRNLE